MPVSKTKATTPEGSSSSPKPSDTSLPEQEDFRQHLRCLAVSAVQVLIEQVMRKNWSNALARRGANALPRAEAIGMPTGCATSIHS